MLTQFTPLSAAIGGALIGLSAALLMLLACRIAGISGIFGGHVICETMRPTPNSNPETKAEKMSPILNLPFHDGR